MASEYTSKQMWICPECEEDYETLDEAFDCCVENKDGDSLSKEYYEQKTVYRCVKCLTFSLTDPTYCKSCAKEEREKLKEWNELVDNINNPHRSGSI